MAEFEEALVNGVIADLEGDPGGEAVSAGTVPMHGGGDTAEGTNYSQYATPMHGSGGEFQMQHGGTGTTPMNVGFNVGGDAAAARPTKLELQAERRATEASLRAFSIGHIPPTGHVAGIEHLHERTEK